MTSGLRYLQHIVNSFLIYSALTVSIDRINVMSLNSLVGLTNGDGFDELSGMDCADGTG